MTNEKQAVKTLADELAKALNNVKNNPVAINASQVVGLPSALYSVLNTLEYKSEEGDEIATKLLNYFHNIAALEVGTIAADEAQIGTLYATFGDFMHLVAESASVGSLDVGQLRADMAAIGLLTLSTADINTAQIEHLSTQDAFIKYGVGGKLYIEDLAISNANIVSLAAGSIMIKDSNGNMVELYVDDQNHISTRSVSYDGDDIINSGSLNGNRIIENSITTNRLNTDEIFAYQGMVMNLVVDNIDATRLFANQGVITQLETAVISSPAIGSGIDISGNSTIQMLQDAIELTASNAGRTYIESHMPFPKLKGDTWFNPSTEEHYVSTGIDMETFPDIAYDDYGNLRVRRKLNSDYNVQLDSNGYFKVYDDIPETHYSIVDGYLNVDGAWKKIDNVAFSNLKISVDGISATVFDSQTGESRIDQSANRISMIVNGTTAVPHVETSSIVIENNKLEISSSGDVDIKANNFSIGFNTSGSASNISRVDINNTDGIKVSDQYGNYFKATTNGIGLYDINNVPNIYMNSNGDAIFAGKMSAECITSGYISADRIDGGTITASKLDDAVNNSISSAASAAAEAQATANGANAQTQLIYKQAISGTISISGTNTWVTSTAESTSSDTAGLTPIWTTKRPTYRSNYPVLFVAMQSKNVSGDVTCTTPIKDDTTTVIDGGHITTGTIDASRATIINIDADEINSGHLSANYIQGGVLVLGGWGNSNGEIQMLDAFDNFIGSWGNNGIQLNKGNINLDYTGSIKIGFDQSDSKYALFNRNGMKLVLESGSKIYTGQLTYHSTNFPSEILGLLGIEYETGVNKWVDLIAPGYFSSNYFENNYSKYHFTYALDMLDLSGPNSGFTFRVDSGEFNIRSAVNITGDTSITGDFSVTGTKNRIVSTDQYSDRLLYCYETPSPMFGDIGEGIIGEDGICYIWLDPIFAQTISTDQYHVFLQRYGAGDCYVSERKGGCFVVTGTSGLRFGWEIKAKQKDFDQRRLERNDKAFTVPDSTYGEDAVQYISELQKGRVSV